MNIQTEATTRKVFHPFEGLIAWQKAHELVLETYRYTRRFPKEEENGLSREFRNSTTQIAAYIAESHKAVNGGKKMQLLLHAQSLLEACHYYTLLSHDLKYGDNRQLYELMEEIDLLLDERIKSVRNNLSLSF